MKHVFKLMVALGWMLAINLAFAKSIEATDPQSEHGVAAKALSKGADEKAMTFKADKGKTIATQECGAVSQLTLVYPPKESAAMVTVMTAAETGQTLNLIDYKCLSNRQAIAKRALIKIETKPPTAEQLKDLCRMPHAKGNLSGC
jgi:hypothetical protein